MKIWGVAALSIEINQSDFELTLTCFQALWLKLLEISVGPEVLSVSSPSTFPPKHRIGWFWTQYPQKRDVERCQQELLSWILYAQVCFSHRPSLFLPQGLYTGHFLCVECPSSSLHITDFLILQTSAYILMPSLTFPSQPQLLLFP